MITETAYDALLNELYAGASDWARMRAFLCALGDATGSHVTSFLREDFANPSASAFISVGVGPEEIHRYSDICGENIWFQRCLPEIKKGAVFDGDEYVTRKELAGSRYYDGFLRHIDTQHSVGICAAFEQKRGAFLTLCRSEQTGAYDEDCMRVFQRLAPHIVNAFALRMQFEHLEAQATQVTLRQRGMFLLDAQWNWVGGNTVADDMLSAGWWRGRLLAPLTPAHSITRTAWQSLQRSFDQGHKLQQVVPVHDKRGALVAFASVHAHATAGIGKHAPSYVLFVRPLHVANTEALSTHLRQLFGLTSAESTFAMAMRANGKIPAAAATVGITESTARVRLQKILEKTGTHRQADLLLMLDALAETVT